MVVVMLRRLVVLIALFPAFGVLHGDETTVKTSLSPEESRQAAKLALEEFNPLVGGWRGVGQPQRNSNKGAWTETGEWVWEIRKESVGLRYNVSEGKQLATALLTYEPAKQLYALEATLPDKSTRRYEGKLADNKLVLESQPDDAGATGTVRASAFHSDASARSGASRRGTQTQFARVAEVGYTREGTKLAEEGLDGPECVVTGGKGTMQVQYKGKTYYVCCTGCRDAFLDDPEGILEEYAERVAKRKKGK
jgi:YHS domain-containing protein